MEEHQPTNEEPKAAPSWIEPFLKSMSGFLAVAVMGVFLFIGIANLVSDPGGTLGRVASGLAGVALTVLATYGFFAPFIGIALWRNFKLLAIIHLCFGIGTWIYLYQIR